MGDWVKRAAVTETLPRLSGVGSSPRLFYHIDFYWHSEGYMISTPRALPRSHEAGEPVDTGRSLVKRARAVREFGCLGHSAGHHCECCFFLSVLQLIQCHLLSRWPRPSLCHCDYRLFFQCVQHFCASCVTQSSPP